MLHNDGGSLEVFKAMVEDLDRSVGEVMSALRRGGQANDTVVVFISDNGGERFSYYWSFSGEKASLLQGGVGIPMC
jgi:arylsulfatase A-like enzyme